MKVGNIVSDEKLSVSCDFNVVKTMDEIIHGLPTLIIDFEYIKKNYKDYKVMNRRLSNNLYWTFKKTEKRDLHDEDLYHFTRKCYLNYCLNSTYLFLDPTSFTIKKTKKILDKLYSSKNIVTYNKFDSDRGLDMLYIYAENIVFGVDLNYCHSFGIDREKLRNKIQRISAVFLESNTIFIEYKNAMDVLENQEYYIPILYSIRNG